MESLLKNADKLLLFGKSSNVAHYYGDEERVLFLLGGVLMLITLPFVHTIVPFSLYISVVTILILSAIAGMTNPQQRWVNMLNTCIALGGTGVFEYYAVTTNWSILTLNTFIFFIANQLLAVIFLLASYFCVKTLRGIYLKG